MSRGLHAARGLENPALLYVLCVCDMFGTISFKSNFKSVNGVVVDGVKRFFENPRQPTYHRSQDQLIECRSGLYGPFNSESLVQVSSLLNFTNPLGLTQLEPVISCTTSKNRNGRANLTLQWRHQHQNCRRCKKKIVETVTFYLCHFPLKSLNLV